MWSFFRIYWPKFSESNLITIADYEVLEMSDFVIGANIDGKHFVGSNWGVILKILILRLILGMQKTVIIPLMELGKFLSKEE